MMKKSLSSLKSLFFKPMENFGARKKTRTQRARYFEARPLYYKKVVKMKLPDFKDPNLQFPLHIPLRNLYVFRPVKKRRLTHHHDYLNFKPMTGNEILLYLENPDNLRASELASALLELRLRDGSSEIEWEAHPWISSCIQKIKSDCSGFSTHNISNFIIALDDLRIRDLELWKIFSKIAFKIIYKARAAVFGRIFHIYMNKTEYSNEGFRNLLMEQLPRFIFKFPPREFTQAFEVVHRTKRMTIHLFREYFYIYIRQRSYYLGVRYLPRCLKVLKERNYTPEDKEFWINSVCMALFRIIKKGLTEKNSQVFINSIEELSVKYRDLKAIIPEAKTRQFFLSTILKSLELNTLHNQVINEIQYFKKMQQEKEEKD